MQKLQFTTEIKTTPDKVWNALWDDANYRKWTSVFSEGSHAETDWEEGSKVYFLAGNGEGMYSRIEKKVPNEFMSFKHLGVMKEGKELPIDEETKKWSGSMENYTLKANGNSTELIVDLDISEDHQEYFQKTFPKALEKVKELAEK